METQKLTYDICRYYLQDNRSELGPLYETILGYLRSRNIAGLSSVVTLVDRHSISVSLLRVLLQIEAFFKKNPSFSNDEVCTSAARISFEESERRCKRTNKRLDWFFFKRHRLDADLEIYLSRMEKHICKVLGPFERFRDQIPDLVRVTAGATSHAPKHRSAPYLKMKRTYRCSTAASPYLIALNRFHGYKAPRIIRSSVNRVEVVPKSWKTHRTIACEPDGSLPFQLAFDEYCKKRLRLFNIDLRFQDRNQEYARLGSIDDSLSTIDLKAASDTVAFNTVAWLFPQPWFQYLNAFRSSTYKGVFGYGKYAKFSSMGNGSTFCIETLLFAAACVAVGSKRYSVYGDDIIIEKELTPKLLKLLKFLGFVVNTDKSFIDGPFRESCGSYWYRGVNVRPFFLRNNARLKTELCHIINGTAAIATPEGALWNYLVELVRSEKLPLVPFNENTMSGIHISCSSAYSQKLIRAFYRKSGDGIPAFRSYVLKTRNRYVGDYRTLSLWYLRSYRRRTKDPIACSSETSATQKYVRKWVCWVPPARQNDAHIYMWTDAVLRES